VSDKQRLLPAHPEQLPCRRRRRDFKAIIKTTLCWRLCPDYRQIAPTAALPTKLWSILMAQQAAVAKQLFPVICRRLSIYHRPSRGFGFRHANIRRRALYDQRRCLNKEDGKKYIQNALWGLGIAIAAWSYSTPSEGEHVEFHFDIGTTQTSAQVA